jgi:hypothetical protein
MNRKEMYELASVLEYVYADDYVRIRLNKQDCQLSIVRPIIRDICSHLRNGSIFSTLANIQCELQRSGHAFFLYPQTKKVLLQYLVPSSCLE